MLSKRQISSSEFYLYFAGGVLLVLAIAALAKYVFAT